MGSVEPPKLNVNHGAPVVFAAPMVHVLLPIALLLLSPTLLLATPMPLQGYVPSSKRSLCLIASTGCKKIVFETDVHWNFIM